MGDPSGIAILVILLLALDVPLRVAFQISRPSMNALLDDAKHPQRITHADQWVGVFYAEDVERTSTGIRFSVDGGFLSFGGFVYFGEVRPPQGTETSYERIGDGWYTWYEDF